MQPPPTPELPRALLITSVQDAIRDLLTIYEPTFLQFGLRLFMAFATIVIAWQGIRMMLVQERGPGDHIFQFAQTLLFVATGYAMIAFYETPIPGMGISFSNLITRQAHYFAHVLEARALEQIFLHLDALNSRFLQPETWAILANLFYTFLLVMIVLAKVAMIFVVCFSLIATAVCGLLGPIFVPFFIVPKMDWLFWSWLKSLIQYSMVEVVGYAFMMIFERFIYRYLTTLPQGMTEAQYLTYGLQAVVVLGTFCAGILLVPSLTSSLFSGRSGESVWPSRIR